MLWYFVEEMTYYEFAHLLGFDYWEDLIRASELLFSEGEVAHYLTQLPADYRHPLTGGHFDYAVWSTAVLSLYHVSLFTSREQALREKYEEFLAVVRNGGLGLGDWNGPDPSLFGE